MESLLKDAHSRALINNKRVSAAVYMLFTEGNKIRTFKNRFSVCFFEIDAFENRGYKCKELAENKAEAYL